MFREFKRINIMVQFLRSFANYTELNLMLTNVISNSSADDCFAITVSIIRQF